MDRVFYFWRLHFGIRKWNTGLFERWICDETDHGGPVRQCFAIGRIIFGYVRSGNGR